MTVLLAIAGMLLHPAPRRPHVLLFVADTLRVDHLGCYGYRPTVSPALDGMARESVVFEQAIAVGGNTTTAMAANITGHYTFFAWGAPWTDAPYGMDRFRKRRGGQGLPRSMTTVAEALAGAGYQTAGFVTNPYVGQAFGMRQGFAHYEEIDTVGAPLPPADTVARRALRFVEAMDPGRPSFVYLHFMDTHEPYPDPGAGPNGPTPGHLEKMRTWVGLHGAPAEHQALRRDMIAAYDFGVRRVDDAVGRMLDAYRRLGLLHDTLVVFTADHGEEFLEHGGTSHKATLYEEIVHVPLLVRPPEGAKGRRFPGLVRSFDVAATLLDYAGASAAGAKMDAVSLRPAVEGRPFKQPVTAYAGFPALRMLRGGRYKLLRRLDGSELFFDLQRDPEEIVDLSASAEPSTAHAHRALAAALDEIVAGLQNEGDPGPPRPAGTVDEATRRRLRALGYGP